ncbi:glycosyltransferase [Parendozoicomonas sp. Alg238-R29]|uniref:glycosyltransferase n=1 Tax=Parendozoicomonas sp. Alg238-R29 TaxID=2993446 RepID=UPI00248DD03A|nr:glycosyltransferase [Parendozoicomonas sp. Alg238-R29]
MKILLIITGLTVGGAERQVCDLAEQFIKKGHSVKIIVLTGPVIFKPFSDIEIIPLDIMKSSFLSFLSGLRISRRVLLEYDPDVVHGHMIHANIFSRILRLIAPVKKLICTAHSTNEGGGGRMLAYRLTDTLCDMSTNVSDEAVKAYINKKAAPDDKIITVNNGLDVSKFKYSVNYRNIKRDVLGVREDNVLLMTVGRLTEAKNHKLLLRVFSLLKEEHKNITLCIIGDGELKEYLIRFARTLSVADSVHFIGNVDDVQNWLSAADVFVLSSLWEGFSLVCAEAMLCERYVIATDCGGVAGILGDKGSIVPVNDIDALYSELDKFIHDRCNFDGEEIRKSIASRFSIESIAAQWIDIYTSV